MITADADRFPPQIKYIVGNEACERFSFYGMKSILTIFMVSRLLMPDNQAEATYHLFVSACYLLPVLGAWISDRFWGKYKTIMTLSIVYCAGHAVLAMWDGRTALYWGLGLISLGAGGIKPCVSAHVGDHASGGRLRRVGRREASGLECRARRQLPGTPDGIDGATRQW